MKRELKKKVIATSIVTGLSTLVVSPIAIVNLSNREESLSFSNKERLGANNSGYNLSPNATAYLGGKDNQNVISTSSSNVTKAIPTGIVTVSNNGRRIICFNPTNPSKLLWYRDLENVKKIYSVEYTSANDTLAILYKDTFNNLNVAAYTFVSRLNSGNSTEPTTIKKIISTEDDHWVLSPVVNFEGSPIYFTIYKRYWKGSTKEANIYLYSSWDNSLYTKKINLKSTKDMVILGASFFQQRDINGRIYATIINEEIGSGSIGVTYYNCPDAPNTNDKWFSAAGGSSTNPYTKLNVSSKAFDNNVNSYIEQLPNSSTTYVSLFKVNNKSTMVNQIPFISSDHKLYVINVLRYWTAESNFPRTPKITTVASNVYDYYFDLNPVNYNGFDGVTQPPRLIYLTRDSQYTTVNIMNNNIDKSGSTDYNYSFSNYQNFNFYNSTTPDWSVNNNRKYYAGWNSPISVNDNNLAAGIPVIEYTNNSSNNSNGRLLLFKSGTSEVAIVNRENYKENTAKYDYYSRLAKSNTTFDLGDRETSLKKVNVDYLNKTFNIDSDPWTNSSFLTNDMQFANMNGNVKFAINPNSLKYDYGVASVSFDLYATQLFKSDGSIVALTLSALKQQWPSDLKIATIKINGYKLNVYNTSVEAGNLLGLDSIFPYEWNTPSSLSKIKQAIIDGNKIIYPNIDITIDNIQLENVNVLGSVGSINVTVKLINNAAMINGIGQNSMSFNSLTYSGFKFQRPTSLISPLVSIGDTSIEASQYYTGDSDKEKVQKLIFNQKNNIFSNLPNQNDFAQSNITIKAVQAFNSNGTLQVTFSLSNYFDNQGNYQSSQSGDFVLTIAGFKITASTTSILGGQLSNVSNIYASTWENNLDVIKQQIISDNKITNPFASSIAIADIELSDVETNDGKGILTATVKLINNKAQVNGNSVPEHELGTVTFSGFKINPKFTTIFDGGQIDASFSKTLASDVDQNDLNFKNAIISLIQNPANEIKINSNNILVEIISSNNQEGSMVVNLSVINNCVWIEGIVQNNYKFTNKTITGFKKQNPTTTIDAIYITNSETPSGFYSSSTTVGNLKVRDLIFENRESIFKNPPSNFSAANIIVESVLINNPAGSMIVSYKLNNWINDQGNQVSVESQNYSLTINGFKTDETSTTIETQIALENVGSFLASNWETNQSTIKQAIIDSGAIKNLFTSVAATDLSFDLIEYNDAIGSLVVNIIINNNHAQENGIPLESMVFYSVTLTGFKFDPTLRTTTFEGGEIIGYSNLTPTQVNVEYNRHFLFQVIGFIKNSANGETITESDVNLVIKKRDNLNGQMIIDLTINNYKYWVNGTPKASYTFTDKILTGFASQKPTVAINELTVPNQSEVTPSSYLSEGTQEANNIKIQNLIFENINTIFGDSLPDDFNISNILITQVSPYNNSGTIVVNYSITSYFDQVGDLINAYHYDEEGNLVNEPENAKALSITLKGFATDNSTTSVTGGQLSSVSDVYASQWEQNQELIKQAIISDGKFKYAADIVAVKDIQFLNAKTGWNSLTVTIVLQNYKAQENGMVVESKNLGTVTFTGFKPDPSFTTTFDGGEVEGFGDVPASSISVSNYQLKAEIIKLIHNPANNQTITPSDIEFSIVSYNNKIGTLTINLIINNNKYWSEGVSIPQYTFQNKVLTGFKNQSPTEQVSNQINSDNSEIRASDFWVSKTDNSKLTSLIFANTSSIFANYPSSFAENNISVVDNSITIDNPNGQLSLKFTINNYYNGSSQLVNTPSGEFSLTITGFKKDSSTTSILGGVLTSVSFAPSSWESNLNKIKQAIINDKKVTNLFVADSLTIDDISFSNVSANDSVGQLTLDVTILNGKAQINGAKVQSWTSSSITFSGFEVDSSLSTTSFVGGLIKGVSEVLASQINDQDLSAMSILKENILPLIKYPASGKTINSQDITIKAVENTVDNTKGTMSIVLTINNGKAWINGVVQQTYTFSPVEISGFKVQLPTGQSQPSLSLPAFNGQSPDAYIQQSNVDQKLQQLLFKSRNNFLSNIPDNFKASNIVIKDKVADNPLGRLQVTYVLTCWFDEKGIEQNTEWKPQVISLLGFESNKDSTGIKTNVQLDGLNEIEASQWDKNLDKIKQAIINSNAIYNLSSSLSITDIELSDVKVNNSDGSIQASVTIKNNKAQTNGIAESTKRLGNVVFSGFKKVVSEPKKNNMIIPIVLMIVAGVLILGVVVYIIIRNLRAK